jgi:hypothetical protein
MHPSDLMAVNHAFRQLVSEARASLERWPISNVHCQVNDFSEGAWRDGPALANMGTHISNQTQTDSARVSIPSSKGLGQLVLPRCATAQQYFPLEPLSPR